MDGPATAVVLQAYRFALDPTPRQARALASHTGASRFAFNWGLELVERRLAAKDAGEAVEVPWTLFELRREWNRAKREVAPWWTENSKEAYSSGLDNLARALANWQDATRGRRSGPRVGFPRRKRKGRGRESCRFTTGAIRLEADRHHVTLPRLGRIRAHESTRKLARRIERDTARILSATITRRGDRWHVSFTCEVERAITTPRRPGAAIGVDVGIRYLAVLSNGLQVAHPAALRRAHRRLCRLDRQLARRTGPRAPDGSQRQPSHGWSETACQLRRIHGRAVDLRRNGLHQLTSMLAATYGTVVVERLNVAGLVRNRRLARQLADAGLGELRRQLVYKTVWSGSTLLEARRFFPSSKLCSRCGHVKAKLSLAERNYRCDRCGFALDRDLNAARNLAALVQSTVTPVAGSGSETWKTPVDGDLRPGSGWSAPRRSGKPAPSR